MLNTSMATAASFLNFSSACCRAETTPPRICRSHRLFCISRRLPRLSSPYPRAILDDSKTASSVERSECDKMVDDMDFGEICNDFECRSSPSVEATARQLARDILELRQGNRALGSYSISVKYKDPIRSFIGRDKYKRPIWATYALKNPKVTVQEMQMLSTSILSLRWTVQGKAKFFDSIDLRISVKSQFVMNQISGQVVEHKESWDLSPSSPVAQSYFWMSRLLFSSIEAGKDAVATIRNTRTDISYENESPKIYRDPSGDPTKNQKFT